MKTSFILHNDSLDILDQISDEEAGKLFKAIRNFNVEVDVEIEPLIKMLFLPFKNQFVRDLSLYKSRSLVNSVNGSKGGKRTQANATKSSERKRNQANQADSDSDSDSDSDKEKKESIRQKVFLTPAEAGKIKQKFGNDFDWALDTLENYKQSTGKKYKSDYHVLTGWVWEKYEKEKKTKIVVDENPIIAKMKETERKNELLNKEPELCQMDRFNLRQMNILNKLEIIRQTRPDYKQPW